MEHLRIVGTQEEDGSSLLVLSDDSGAEYALPLDSALRAAVGRPSSRRPADQTPSGHLSPRDIQARLRAGATVDEVIEDSGLSPAYVQRYAGPVQAERGYIAQRARGTEVAPPSSAEQHRMAFGDAPATLEAMVTVRLRMIDVDAATVIWDSWRREDGLWQVVCWFELGPATAASADIGAQPPAEWSYSPTARQLTPLNSWAESLSALPTGGADRRTRRLAPVDAPFDVETGERLTGAVIRPVPADEQDTSPIASPASTSERPPERDSHEELLDMLRARRGRRIGADENSDDRLAEMLTRDEEPGPRLRAVEPDAAQSADEPADDGPEDSVGQPRETQAQTDAWGFSYEDPGHDESERGETGDDRNPGSPGEPDDGSWQSTLDDEAFGGAAQRRPKAPKRSSSRRPSIPKWDDILFGRRED